MAALHGVPRENLLSTLGRELLGGDLLGSAFKGATFQGDPPCHNTTLAQGTPTASRTAPGPTCRTYPASSSHLTRMVPPNARELGQGATQRQR